ncbi:MAG: hypothetical protein ACR2KM_04245, partial [Gemmatimonadaceae bacterium]
MPYAEISTTIASLVVKVAADISKLRPGFDNGVSMAQKFASRMADVGKTVRGLDFTPKVDTAPFDAATSAVRQLESAAISAVAAFAGFQALKSAISTGLEFNQTIETSTLGIASLIAAESKLSDASGHVVTGSRALDVAMSLSTDQVNKLRIAGLQTAATTSELIVAFQQAVGAGLSAGLSLDSIRKITISTVQAATTLGVPLNQLSQEVRSILDGTIDRNSRVATALQITNAQVAAAKANGTVVEYLTARMEAFSTAGARVATTYQGAVSNVTEAAQVFSGAATASLFNNLRDGLNKALAGVFDLDNARIDTAFKTLLDVVNEIGGRIGDGIGNAVLAVIEKAKEFSRWLGDN